MGILRLRHLITISSTVIVGCCSYYVYKWWRKRQFKSIDEGFEDVSKIDDNPVKKVLVLGLKNAGKSAILSKLTSDTAERNKDHGPTEGFNVFTLEQNEITHNIWEIGGGDKFRQYWANFFQDTDVLLFVVDSTDLQSLAMAVREFQLLLADDRLAWVPILILAHKQDLPNAMKPEKVADALDVKNINKNRHPITVLGTQVSPISNLRHSSISELNTVLNRLLKD